MECVSEKPPKASPLFLHPKPYPLSASPDSPLVADDIYSLELLSVAGCGGGGTVYKVRCLHNSALFAFKILRLDSNAAREVEISLRANSPFTVRCYGVVNGGAQDRICLAMEYMSGGSLRSVLLSRRSLPEELVAALARRVLVGLRCLHGMGIVHGDIKSDNLLIGEQREVKIADFGSSRIAGEADECLGAGTCGYMSPERFDSEGFGGSGGAGREFAGDIWALGVMVPECYAGRFPLVEAGKQADIGAVLCAVFLDEPLEAMQSFVRRCMEKEWKKRGTAEELLSHPFVAKCCSTKGLIDN